MKELNKINRFGYITQGLDLTLRARTINNEIICLNVSPEGTSGTCKNQPIELPEIIKKIDRIVYLLQILKTSQLTLKDGKLTINDKSRNTSQASNTIKSIEDCTINSLTNRCVKACPANLCVLDGLPCDPEACGLENLPYYCPIIF